MKRPSLIALICFVLGLSFGAQSAAAQVCTPTMDNVTFGTVDTTNNTAVDLTFTLTISCTGGANGERLRFCPSIGTGSGGANANGSQRYMLNGTTQMAFNIYSNAARTNVWGSYFWGRTPTPPTLNLRLNNAGAGVLSRLVYVRIFAGQTSLPSGLYTSSFSGSHTLFAYDDRGTIATCDASDLANQTTMPFVASATNDPTCSVAATDLVFPDRGFLDTNVTQSSTIDVTCPNTLPYTIALDGGLSGAADPTQRELTLGGETITYGLFRDNTYTQPWGSTSGPGGNVASGTGNGASQSHTVYGRILAQTTPTPGVYSDTIVVTVSY